MQSATKGIGALLVLLGGAAMAQQAVFDSAAGVLRLPAVKVGNSSYIDVVLDLTDAATYTFKLRTATQQVPPSPTNNTFDTATGLLSIPSVAAGGAAYSATLRLTDPRSYTFTLATADRIQDRGLAPSSYRNAKGLNIGPQRIPLTYTDHSNAAHAFADFFQRGEVDLFVASITAYNYEGIEHAAPSRFEFWRRQPDGSFAKDPAALPDATGCITPRKAIVADFNHDGRPDVFVACTGFDGPPYPGEFSAVILSLPDGRYATHWIPYTAYMHGAAAGDITGSGHIDVVAVNPLSGAGEHVPVVLVNDGHGQFTVRQDLLPAAAFPPGYHGRFLYTVEVLDLDGDNRADILLMGDDSTQFASPPIILFNDGSGTFAAAPMRVLPSVTDTFVLDAVLVGRDLYLLRTGSVPGNFYTNRILQRVNLDTGASAVVDQQTTPVYYVDWLVPYSTGTQHRLVSDDMDHPYAFTLPP